MELRQLQYFITVARIGSFLGAAPQFNLTQPSLWRQVKALENELGVALFERSGRKVKLSSAGTQLVSQAEQVLAQAEKMRVLSRELSRGRAGVLTIACAYPHVPSLLAPLITTFNRLHPDIHIALNEMPGLPQIDQVLLGDVDFVTSLAHNNRRLAGKQLGEARIVVVTSDEHPWRNKKRIKVSDLAGVPVVTGGPLSLTRRLLEPALREQGLSVEIVHETPNMTTLMSMARAGLGVGLIGDDILRDELDSRWPVLCDDSGPMATPIWIYWSAQRPLAPTAQQFVHHIERNTKR